MSVSRELSPQIPAPITPRTANSHSGERDRYASPRILPSLPSHRRPRPFERRGFPESTRQDLRYGTDDRDGGETEGRDRLGRQAQIRDFDGVTVDADDERRHESLDPPTCDSSGDEKEVDHEHGVHVLAVVGLPDGFVVGRFVFDLRFGRVGLELPKESEQEPPNAKPNRPRIVAIPSHARTRMSPPTKRGVIASPNVAELPKIPGPFPCSAPERSR